MSGKFKLKHKDVKPNLKEKEVDARSKEPLFCFKYLDMKTSLKGCDNSVFKDFVTRMQKLCCLTWKDINVSGKHQYGFEIGLTNAEINSDCLYWLMEIYRMFGKIGKIEPYIMD